MERRRSCNSKQLHHESSTLQLLIIRWLQLQLQVLPHLLIIIAGDRLLPTAVSQHLIKSLPGYPDDLPFTLETGYIGVADLEEVQLFYYFIESERNPGRDPLILWSSGGPGCSAFLALTYENGPLSYVLNDTGIFDWVPPQFTLNPYSWTKFASMLYLDTPAGAGFSYARSPSAYDVDDTQAAAHIYEFLRKWLIGHPSYVRVPLYIAGDSYAGKMVPLVVQNIINGIVLGLQPQMHIMGYISGNPITYEEKDTNSRIEYGHRVSLISDELYESAKLSCNGDYVNVPDNNTECLKKLAAINDCIAEINLVQILEPSCTTYLAPRNRKPLKNGWIKDFEHVYFDEHFPLRSSFHPEDVCRFIGFWPMYLWTNDQKVRKALHVREGTVDAWVRCNYSIPYTKNLKSVVDVHQNLTKAGIRALVYSGDQDMLVSYLGTHEWIKSLNVSINEDWRPWFVDGEVAGYTTRYATYLYSMTYATVMGAGHTAPQYKPRESFALIDRWLSYSPI